MVGIGPSPNRPGIHMVKCRKKRGGREGSSARARSAAQQHSERDGNGYSISCARDGAGFRGCGATHFFYESEEDKKLQ